MCWKHIEIFNKRKKWQTENKTKQNVVHTDKSLHFYVHISLIVNFLRGIYCGAKADKKQHTDLQLTIRETTISEFRPQYGCKRLKTIVH